MDSTIIYAICSIFLANHHISLLPIDNLFLQRKANIDKGAPKPRPQKGPKNLDSSASNMTVSGSELDDRLSYADTHQNVVPQQRTKRPTKSVNENLEPAFTASTILPEN